MIVDCFTSCFLDCTDSADQILFPEQISKGISVMGAFDCFPFLALSFIQAQEAICEIVIKDKETSIHVDPKDYQQEVKNVGIKNWKYVNPNHLEKYVKAFLINAKDSLP